MVAFSIWLFWIHCSINPKPVRCLAERRLNQILDGYVKNTEWKAYLLHSVLSALLMLPPWHGVHEWFPGSLFAVLSSHWTQVSPLIVYSASHRHSVLLALLMLLAGHGVHAWSPGSLFAVPSSHWTQVSPLFVYPASHGSAEQI